MSKTAMSRGYAISYEDVGRGSPIVLIPGYMHSAANFREVGYVNGLAERWKVLAVDPLGHGESDKPYDPTPYRAPGVCADMIAVLDAAGVERAVLWGYSRGAWLATMAAIEFPNRVSGLIIGGAAFTDPPRKSIPQSVESLSRGDWAACWQHFPIPLDPEARDRFQRSNDPKALFAVRAGSTESAYEFDLSRVSAPALIYCGGNDVPEEAIPTAEALRTELRVVDGCDHLQTFAEADRVMAFAIPFLETISSRPARVRSRSSP